MKNFNKNGNSSQMTTYRNLEKQNLEFELCELKSNPLYKQELVDYFEELLEGHELMKLQNYYQIKICFNAALNNLEIQEK